MERSIAFYRDVFGWEQLFDERMHRTRSRRTPST